MKLTLFSGFAHLRCEMIARACGDLPLSDSGLQINQHAGNDGQLLDDSPFEKVPYLERAAGLIYLSRLLQHLAAKVC